jgi:hypothetical protein
MILGRYKQSDGIGVAFLWEGMGQMRNGNKFLIGKLERKMLRGRLRCKFMDNVKVNLKGFVTAWEFL